MSILVLECSWNFTDPFSFCSVEDGKPKFDVIFGPAYKGISLGAVVCAALYSSFGVDVGFAYNRKEAKAHGEGGKLVGASMDGKRILVSSDLLIRLRLAGLKRSLPRSLMTLSQQVRLSENPTACCRPSGELLLE